MALDAATSQPALSNPPPLTTAQLRWNGDLVRPFPTAPRCRCAGDLVTDRGGRLLPLLAPAPLLLGGMVYRLTAQRFQRLA